MPDSTYKPGACNIGQKEIAVRRKFYRFFLPVTLLLSFAAFFWYGSLVLWLLTLSSAFALLVLYFEINYRFCILFGFFSLYNFEKLGTLNEVKNPADAKRDRRRVFEIVVQSLLISMIYATALHLVAAYVHLN